MPKTLMKPSTSRAGPRRPLGHRRNPPPRGSRRPPQNIISLACRFCSRPFVLLAESRMGRPSNRVLSQNYTNLLGDRTVRFMMIVKANKDSEAGKMPSEELLAAMAKYNEELVNAGILVDLAGL